MTQFKKTTSIVVALVMILSVCFSIPMTVSAAAESSDTYTSFEIGSYNKNVQNQPGDFASGTGVFGLSTTEAHSGSTSLKYDTTNDQCLRFAYAYNGTKSALKLESNTTYTITFWYKATAKSDWINIHLALWNDIKADNAYSDDTRDDILKQSVEVMNEWTKVSVNVTTEDCSERAYLIFGVNGGGSASKVVYIDDVSVVKYVPVENTDTFTSFEGVQFQDKDQQGGFYSSTSLASISDEDAYSGLSSLRFDSKTNPQQMRTIYAYNGEKSALCLESDSAYTITFWYKATAKQGWANLHFRLCDGAKSSNAQGDAKDLIKQGVDVVGEWTKVSVNVTTEDCSANPYIVIGLNAENGGTVVFVDDITVTKLIKGTDTYTSFEGVEVNSTDTSAGFYSTGLASASNEEAHSGFSSLKLDSKGNSNIVRFAYAYNAAKNAIKLESNSTYVVTYWYKATALPGWANIRLRLGDAANVNNSNDDSDISKFTELVQGEWTEVSVTVNTGDCSAKPYLLVGFHTEFANTVIYIDDITVTKVEVEEPEDTQFVAVSKRDEGLDDEGNYQSAGIRFKNRVTADFRASATEIGFIAAPTSLLGGMTIAEYYATADNLAISAKVLGEGMDEIIYKVSTENGVKFYDYQMMIKGLTRENSDVNLLDEEITVVLYAIIDGEMVFTDSVAYSYNTIAALPAAN